MHKVAHDHEFLYECLKSAIKSDDFTRRMWKIYEHVRKEGVAQPISLALNRSDYMVDCGVPWQEIVSSGKKVNLEDVKLKQIEFNTMASSFGGLCTKLSAIHRKFLERNGYDKAVSNLPPNSAADGLAEGMVKAWDLYGNQKAAILFLVYDAEKNTYDQRWIEYKIQEINYKIKVVRMSIHTVAEKGSLGPNKELIVDGEEIAIVYYRSCYTPVEYKTDKEWDARMLMERSRAIKCPSIHYHLAGTKKVQQVLAKPGTVEKYISDPEAVTRIRATFAGQYSLDMDQEGDASVKLGMENPSKFVMKPQREGGGNNTFGEDIKILLSKIGNAEKRSAYILMERIHPTPVKNYCVRTDCQVELCDMVSELGTFGILVGTSDNIFLNNTQGHILRTKTVGTDEGGVATGYSSLDSPYLI